MGSAVLQNLLVLQQGTGYKAVTEFTHEIIFESQSAQAVIQGAVDAMGEGGGEVVLSRGDFPLNAPVALRRHVRLRGCGRGTKLRVSVANKARVGLLCEQQSGVVVEKLALIAEGKASTGIIVDGSGDCKVQDVLCTGFSDYGIWLRNNAFLCEIRGCRLAGNGRANLYLDHLREGEYGDYVPNLVTNCIIYGGGKGIETKDAIVVNIVACAVYQTRDIAYHIHTSSNSVLISGCRSFQIDGHAVVVEGSHEFNLSSNVFCWHTGHGVVIDDCYWGTISGNEVIDTGSYNPGTANFETHFDDLPEAPPRFNGINLLHTRGYSVTGNTVFNWSVAPKMQLGIWEDDASYNNTITGNNVNYYEQAAVLSTGKDSLTANNVGYADHPYNDEEGRETRMQSFQRHLTDLFIDAQL